MFKPKTANIFLDWSEYSILAAKTVSFAEPLTVEALNELPIADKDQLDDFVRELLGTKKGQYAIGRCGIHPTNRFIRRCSLENPNKARDPVFLPDYLQQQFKIDVGTNRVAVLNAKGGAEFDVGKGQQKEILFAGAPNEEVRAIQDDLVAASVVPERLEISALATIGGLMDYCRFSGMTEPMLYLDLGYESSHVMIINGADLDVARPIPGGVSSMFPLVQAELGLKDEESAQKLFHANTFDFTEMAPTLLKRLLRELQATSGFYEVQTGQTITHLFLGTLPRNLSWIGESLARSLGVSLLDLRYVDWVESLNINVPEEIELSSLDARWFNIFSLMGNFDEVRNPDRDVPVTVDEKEVQ